MLSDSAHHELGPITPPEDHWKHNWDTDVDPLIDPTVHAEHCMSTRERSHSGDLASGAGAGAGGGSGAGGGGGGGGGAPSAKVGKKDKYREKNRVAAAKCRAKKKEHTDGLEETHRTQSMLNALLKQTEQNLRDELSFWRTQALQHAFCDCSAIQEYNMRKARALAADTKFGDLDNFRRDSTMAQSPTSKSAMAFYSQHPHPEFDAQPS